MEIPVIGVSIWGVAKIFVLIAVVLYLVFGLVMVKQVHMMTKTFVGGFEWAIKLGSYIHLAFSVVLFLVALAIL